MLMQTCQIKYDRWDIFSEVKKCISAGKFKKINVKMTNMKVEKTRQEGKL